MSLRITIHGSYGTGNRGDGAILVQLLRFLDRETPEAEVTILCRNEERLRGQLDQDFPASNLRLRLLNASFRIHPLAVLRASMGCDLFILGGGGLIWGRASGNLGYWLLRPRLAQLAGKHVVFYAPGINALVGRRARQRLRSVARRAAFLSARDNEGAELLSDIGLAPERIVLGADPAFLMDTPDPGRAQEVLASMGLADFRPIALSARDWGSRLSAGFLTRHCADLLSDPRRVILFMAFKAGGDSGDLDRNDLDVYRALQKTLPHAQAKRLVLVDSGHSLEEVIALISGCEYLLGMRLHSLIFATLAGTPFGALPYNRKIDAYMEMLGRRDFLLQRGELGNAQALQDLGNRLAAEREAAPSGPHPGILASAATLRTRSAFMHSQLAERLRELFSES